MKELNDNNKSRKWFLTINPSALCYDDVKELVESQNKCRYAYIVHSFDKYDDGTPKLRHYHICLDYENARTFKTMKNTFKGAHIETPISWTRAVQYLTHKNDEKKYQYMLSSVGSNDFDYYTSIYNEEYSTITRFDFNKLRDYYIEYSNSFTKWTFIFWLTRMFRLDIRRIIKDEKLIIQYIDTIAMNDDELVEDTTKALKESIL